MGNEGWINKRFDQCAELIRETVDPKELNNVPYIGLEHIAQESLCLVGYGTSGDVNSAKSRFKKGDILFGKLRPYFRKVVIAPFDGVCSTDIWVVRSKPETDNKFLFYWMASHDFIEESTRSSEGTRMPRAKWEFVSRIEKFVPQQSEQRAIGSILGALDDKIELNRQMCKTLEETAQAIFKSWFVDFDPVHDKVAGKHPEGLKPEIAALFPDSFVDTEIGRIPKGWEYGRLGNLMNLSDSKRIPLSSLERESKKGTFPYYGAAGIIDYINDYLFDGVFILVGEDGSVITTTGNPVVQYVWGKFWVNNHAHVIQAKNGVTTEHLFLILKNLIVTPYVTGAVQPKISQTNLSLIKVLSSSISLNKFFGACIAPLMGKYRALVDENISLNIIRDNLITKLISGTIRIKEAEQIVERCS